MRIYFNRFRFRAEVEALFMKAGRSSHGMGRYVKGRYIDRIGWSLKGWITRSLADNKDKIKENKK